MGNNIEIGPCTIVTVDGEVGDGVTFGVNSAVLPVTRKGRSGEDPGRRLLMKSASAVSLKCHIFEVYLTRIDTSIWLHFMDQAGS